MLKRRAQQSEEASKSGGPVHFHGPETGNHDRMIVWSLGSIDGRANDLASRAITEALSGDHSSDVEPPVSVAGAIKLDLGRTTHEDAAAKAIMGHDALTLTQAKLTPEQRGVGISTKVMSFPDKE